MCRDISLFCLEHVAKSSSRRTRKNAPNENPPVPVFAPPPKAGVEVAFWDPNKPPPPVAPVLLAPNAGVALVVLPNPPVSGRGEKTDVHVRLASREQFMSG